MHSTYIKSWLTFNTSVAEDFIKDNTWIIHGNPTISSENAASGNALQLDGNSYLESSEIEFGGGPFSIYLCANVNSSTPDGSRLLHIKNVDTGNVILTVRKTTVNGVPQLQAWRNGYSDASADYGTWISLSSSSAYRADSVGNKVYITIRLPAPPNVGTQNLYFYCSKANDAGYGTTSTSFYYDRTKYKIFLGSSGNGTSVIGSIDEFILFDGMAYYDNVANRTPAYFNPFVINFYTDTQRKVNSSNRWVYENQGDINTLINTTTAVQLENLTDAQSKTGKAFYQTETGIKLFDVPTSKEIWVKFDVFFNGSQRWRCYDISTDPANNKITGITAQTTSDISGSIDIFNISINKKQLGYQSKKNKLQTIILHMIADSSDGLIEVYLRTYPTEAATRIGGFKGSVNNGVAFSNLYLQSDGAGTFFSNIVISNEPLWLDDTLAGTSTINFLTDTERRIESSVSLSIDTEREIVSGVPVSYAVDVERTVYRTTSVSYVVDIERVLTNTVAVQLDTERDLTNTVVLNLDTERVLTDGDPVTVVFDTMRMTHVPATEWRYENIGKTDTLHNTTTAVQLTDLPNTQSKTGVAFYQTDYAIDLFNGTQSSKEVWMRFDVYRTASGVWFFYGLTREYDGGYYTDLTTGVSIEHIWKPISDKRLDIWNGTNGHIELDPGTAKENEIQSVLIHAVGGSAEQGGLLEVFTDNGGLIYEYHGQVHDSNIFNAYGMEGDSGAYVSNIIISNQPVWLDDDAAMSEAVRVSFDTSRQVEKTVTFAVDTERTVLTDSQSITVTFDTSREIVLGLSLAFDTTRNLSIDLSFRCDTERMLLGGGIEIVFDMERQIAVDVAELFDKERVIGIAFTSSFDTERTVIRVEIFSVDTTRWIPYQLDITTEPEEDPTVIPIAPNDAGLQSINIQITEQQITDRVSFVHAGNCNIMDKIQGTFRDYVFDLRIEETDRQGILQTCSCCSDIDELLYSQIAYTIPENKYEWSEDYLEMLGIVQEESEEEIEAQPTTTTEEHLRTIAEILGKNLVYRGVKFYSTNSVNENGGKTYASVISELIGWSSRLPHMEINAYFRGDTLYVIQRGFEANTVSLAGAKIANLRVNQKLIRTTWGSDVKSESTVDTFINTWQELELEPYTPSGGGGGTTTYNDDGLVETTTTESASEKTETTYHYATGPSGEKYLAYEETTKYELDDRGNWQEYDTIVTTHDRVSTTQSHIYSESADGTINGEVVSPNRFDDRATPYDLGHGSRSRGFILLHDSQGNTYKCYSIAYYSEQMEKGTRTTYGLSLVDTSFPLYGEDCLTYLTQQLMWLNRKTEETISLDVYDVDHIIGFDDKISYNGATYYLRSNNVLQDERTVNKQSLVMVRWF